MATSPAVVVGLGLHHRLGSVVDPERCRRAGVDVLSRKAGGGALLLERDGMVCGAICLPISAVASDVTESYRWLGDLLVQRLRDFGIAATRVEVDEAREDAAALHATNSPLLNTCYGALSPHEVVVDDRKLVGMAQIRRRDAALFQFGILLRDQSPLADYLVVNDEQAREQLRHELANRTIGLASLTARSTSEVVAAIGDAMPSAP
jgi:lipoate-protein ligase A